MSSGLKVVENTIVRSPAAASFCNKSSTTWSFADAARSNALDIGVKLWSQTQEPLGLVKKSAFDHVTRSSAPRKSSDADTYWLGWTTSAGCKQSVSSLLRARKSELPGPWASCWW
eukprot:1150835-Pelagomonas_calceolata.AAC.2